MRLAAWGVVSGFVSGKQVGCAEPEAIEGAGVPRSLRAVGAVKAVWGSSAANCVCGCGCVRIACGHGVVGLGDTWRQMVDGQARQLPIHFCMLYIQYSQPPNRAPIVCTKVHANNPLPFLHALNHESASRRLCSPKPRFSPPASDRLG